MIGIHTNAGCTSGGGSNQGTSFEHTLLETALRNFVSPNAVFVDAGMPGLGVVPDGTVFRPFPDFASGAVIVPTGGVVSLVKGTHHPASSGPLRLTKAMTLQAPVWGRPSSEDEP